MTLRHFWRFYFCFSFQLPETSDQLLQVMKKTNAIEELVLDGVGLKVRCTVEWAQIGHYSETLFPSIFHVPFV